jgi:lipopolysaccharide transport system ATP-binding protein
MSRPIIEVENLSKVYKLGAIAATSLKEECFRLWEKVRGGGESAAKGDFWALRDVSFTVQPGEVVGIIGRNGAGKSTLLKLLAHITQQTTGKITLRGRVASLLEVGTGFHPDLSGRENIFLNGAILGMTRLEIKSKLDEIVAFAEVEQFLDTPVKRYSSGMYVRLAFAVAAHLEPEILIVDEVLAVGDVQFQKKCLGRMDQVSRKDGRTVLFVSHNMAAINTLCHNVVLLRGGQIQAIGPTAAVAKQYMANFGLSAGKISLAHRTNSNPAVTVIDGWLENKGTASAEFVYGDDLEVFLKVQVNEPITYGVEFFLKDELGASVGFCPSDLQNGPGFSSKAGVVLHHCTMPSIFLVEGRYSLDILISKPLVATHESIESAFLFDVGPSSFPGTTRRITQQGGQGALILNIVFDLPTPEPQSHTLCNALPIHSF